MKVAVPKHLIPKPAITCVQCGSDKVRTLMSSPFNHGYHRRHLCKDCKHNFYSLSPYDMGPPTLSAIPFHDEEIGEAEEEARWDMWRSIEEAYRVTMEVPLWQRLMVWAAKDTSELTPTEEFAVKMYRALEKKLKEMEDGTSIHS